MLRRLDCVLEPTKEKVLGKQAEFRSKKLQNLDPQLTKISGFAFYITSRYDFDKLLADATHAAANLRHYIAGFSQNMREVLERFDFDNTISKLDEAGLLFQVPSTRRGRSPHYWRGTPTSEMATSSSPRLRRALRMGKALSLRA